MHDTPRLPYGWHLLERSSDYSSRITGFRGTGSIQDVMSRGSAGTSGGVGCRRVLHRLLWCHASSYLICRSPMNCWGGDWPDGTAVLAPVDGTGLARAGWQPMSAAGSDVRQTGSPKTSVASVLKGPACRKLTTGACRTALARMRRSGYAGEPVEWPRPRRRGGGIPNQFDPDRTPPTMVVVGDQPKVSARAG